MEQLHAAHRDAAAGGGAGGGAGATAHAGAGAAAARAGAPARDRIGHKEERRVCGMRGQARCPYVLSAAKAAGVARAAGELFTSSSRQATGHSRIGEEDDTDTSGDAA